MTRVTADLGISLDGFAAGPDQSMDHPLGVGGLHLLDDWMFDAAEENAAEVEAIVARSAFIMGRNMFGPPEGGDWDDAWRGWWGEDPPYHAPVFVLTHHERDDLPMDGGTTFHFVTTASRPPSTGPARRPATAKWASWAAPRRRASTLPPDSSTSCGCTWCRWCSGRGSASWRIWPGSGSSRSARDTRRRSPT